MSFAATPLDPAVQRKNLRTAIYSLIFAACMVGMGFAAVPLYDLFCRVTGFGGTTQIASESQAAGAAQLGIDKEISIRFDASTAYDVGWDFRPEQSTDIVRIGQRDIATYIAKNNEKSAITGTATFNVEPSQAGKYFHKIQCFCFTEQTLAAGEEVTMPVLYYIDPAILEDEFMQDVEQITLSYTFHRAKEAKTFGLARGN